ncbi:MAG: energy transducer TonB [Cytophagales bacterium]|nr:energy transducer TonB [Cytophagales bacterium]
MEPKKKPEADLNRSRGVFLSIGFLLSLFIVIVAFEWKTFEGGLLSLGKLDEFEEQIEIPITEQPPPPPPEKVIEIIEVLDEEEIEDEIEVDLDVEFDEDTVIAVEDAPEEEDTDKIFLVVEKQPEPKGGIQAFNKYIGSHINYPEQARRAGVQGRVYIQFVVDKDGSLTDVKAVKGIGMGCDQEAVRVVKKAPKWNPGKQRGRAVRVKMVIPILFTL